MLVTVVLIFASDCVSPVRSAVVVKHGYVAPVVAHHGYVHQNAYSYAAVPVPNRELEDALAINRKLTETLSEELRARREESAALRQSLLDSGGPQALSPQAKPDAVAILNKSCATCHAGDKPKGGFALTATPNWAQKALVREAVESGTMPPKDKPITDAEREALIAWATPTKEELKAAAKAEVSKK